MEFDDYESLPTENVGIHMIAGAVAGIMEHCVMYPVDSVKTRMQSLAPVPEANYHSVREGLFKMINTEGIFKTVRGVSAVIAGAGPAHAMYFSAYEGIKKKLSYNLGQQSHFANAAAGCGATLVHDAIMVPSEVIKQRMQMYNSPYRSCFDCMCKLYCQEGMRVFYRSYTTQMLMNIPFHVSHIMIYEKLSNTLNPSREYNPKIHMFAGACGGAFAAALTTPLDMCKTLLNTQEKSALLHVQQTRITGVFHALQTVYMMQGLPGFFRGIQARVLYQVPGTAIAWSVYELFKHILANKSTFKCNSSNKNKSNSFEHDLKDYGLESTSPVVDTGTKLRHTIEPDKFYATGPAQPRTVEQIRSIPVPTPITASCSDKS